MTLGYQLKVIAAKISTDSTAMHKYVIYELAQSAYIHVSVC